MAYVTTTIKVDYDLNFYARKAAKRQNFTYAAYYEDLLLKDLRDNHPDFLKEFVQCKEVDKVADNIRNKNTVTQALKDGRRIIDSEGVPIDDGSEKNRGIF